MYEDQDVAHAKSRRLGHGLVCVLSTIRVPYKNVGSGK